MKQIFQSFDIGAGSKDDTSYPLGILFPVGVWLEDIQFIKDPNISEFPREAWIEIIFSQKLEGDSFSLEAGGDDIIKIGYDSLVNGVERIIFQEKYKFLYIRVVRNSGADILGFHTKMRFKPTNGNTPKILKPAKLIKPKKIRGRRG